MVLTKLAAMPDSFLQAFLRMMHQIEYSDTPWPAQLCFGTVIGLAKIDAAHDVGHFRPITLFSTLYRTWARLRTKQLLRQMVRFVPPEALGFLPKRETTEVWLVLQAQIEPMLQQDHTYCGLLDDLKRAFNNIGRTQVFLVAKRLGLPAHFLGAWQKFLGCFVRRFDVLGSLGEELTSVSGFPEGCPLSIISTLVVNWSYHVYMKAFSPRVTTFSFADNITLAAREALVVMQAFFALKTICSLFGLDTDDDKTYVWGLHRAERLHHLELGFQCLTDASELGGATTYGASRRNRVLRARGDQLQDRWKKLKTSMAPQLQKYSILPKVFWPQALHGSSNCLISDSYATTLHRAATKALGVSGAGSNPMLRLSLADDMAADPGFYQLQLCISTFCRMLRKSDDLLPMWRTWMHGSDGKALPGPFFRLIYCLSGIGWAVDEPPTVFDHDGRSWNLMLVDSKTLQTLLKDAWLQYVASQVKHKTMSDLHGIAGEVTLKDAPKMSSLDRARLSALHSGAFVSNYEHSKYDSEKTPMCPSCNTEDDREHWLHCPRFQHLRMNTSGWLPDNVELPKCTIHHLLVPRLELLVSWRHLLYAIPDSTQAFCFPLPKNGLHHLFLDGLCAVEAKLIKLYSMHPGAFWMLLLELWLQRAMCRASLSPLIGLSLWLFSLHSLGGPFLHLFVVGLTVHHQRCRAHPEV